MKLLLAVLIVSSILAGCLCDVRYIGQAINKEFPHQCYYEALKQPIPKNQSYKPLNRGGHCESIYCRSDYVLEIEFCGRHNLQPNKTCRIDSDMRLAYPKCCSKLVCQTDNNYI